MTRLFPKTYQHHDETCCTQQVSVGSRYEREVLDYATGITSNWKCTVVAVDPVDFTRIFCRRVTVLGDDGRSCKPQVPDLLGGKYKPIDNIVAFPASRNALDKERG